MIAVRVDDPCARHAADLIARHFAAAHANSPAGFRFVLGPEALATPGIVFLTAWDGDTLAGMGALKDFGDGSGEVKSMRTDPAHLRKGVGAAVLERIVAEARARGLVRIRLETGTGEDFAAAHALYRRFGFADCAAFGDYPVDSPHNRYMTLEL